MGKILNKSRGWDKEFNLLRSTVHLRLKRDKVLLVLIIHFASYDVGDIHYYKKKKRGGEVKKNSDGLQKAEEL